MTCSVCSTPLGYIDVDVVTPNLFRAYICGVCANLVPDPNSVIEPIPEQDNPDPNLEQQ